MNNILEIIKERYPHYTEKQVIKLAMHLDMMMFAKVCSREAMFNKSPDFHYEIAKTIQNDKNKRVNIISFRGSAKSTIISHILPMWKVCTKAVDEPCYILIISESLDQSKNFLQRIKDELTENPKIHEYFGDLGESTAKRWQMDDIILANGSRIKAFGTGQKPRGVIQRHSRPNLIIIDDFESETNASTPERRIANRKWVTEAITPTLTPDGRIIMVGTVISEDCFLLWAKEASSWITLEYSIIGNDGKPAWEDRFPMDKIQKIKLEFEEFGNLGGFYQEFMNMPQAPEDAPFKNEWFKYHAYSVVNKNGKNYLVHDNNPDVLIPCYLTCGVDLASTLTAKSDFTVFSTVAHTKDKSYVIDVFSMKADPAYHPDKLVNYFLKYKHDSVAIETIAYQETMRASVKRLCEERNIYMPGIERGLKERSSKSERIMSLVPLVARGKLLFRAEMINTIKQFLSFPKGKKDDEIDSIWNAMSRAKKPFHSQPIPDDNKKNKKNKKNSVDWMTL